MAIPSRTARAGTFFITSRTYNSRRLFQVPANAQLFVETLQHYRREGNFLLHAYVVVPDHIHLLLTPKTITLERTMSLIKGGFSRRMASRLPVWQRGYTDHRIRDQEDFETHCHYIQLNPVRANHSATAEQYPYSSAHRIASKSESQGGIGQLADPRDFTHPNGLHMSTSWT